MDVGVRELSQLPGRIPTMFAGALDDITKVVVKHNVDTHNVLHKFGDLPPSAQKNLDSIASSLDSLAKSIGGSLKLVAVGILSYCLLKGISSLVFSCKVPRSIKGGSTNDDAHSDK